MMPNVLVYSILLFKLIHLEGACLELMQGIECLEPTFIPVHQISKIICKVTSLKLQINT